MRAADTADNEGADTPRTWASCWTTGRSDELQDLARQLHDREKEVLLRDMEVGGCGGPPMGGDAWVPAAPGGRIQ